MFKFKKGERQIRNKYVFKKRSHKEDPKNNKRKIFSEREIKMATKYHYKKEIKENRKINKQKKRKVNKSKKRKTIEDNE